MSKRFIVNLIFWRISNCMSNNANGYSMFTMVTDCLQIIRPSASSAVIFAVLLRIAELTDNIAIIRD